MSAYGAEYWNELQDCPLCRGGTGEPCRSQSGGGPTLYKHHERGVRLLFGNVYPADEIVVVRVTRRPTDQSLDDIAAEVAQLLEDTKWTGVVSVAH